MSTATSTLPTLTPAEQHAQEMQQKAIERQQRAAERAEKPRRELTRGQRKAIIKRRVQSFLLSGGKSVIEKYGHDRLQEVLESVFETAVDRRSPQQVAAARELLDRGFDKAKPSTEELDAVEKSGIRLVYVDRAALPVEEKRELPAPQPDFLPAEFEENK